MQTVNFQCGHCGNLMAVSTEYLGQQVRCPTCQQVVVAPQPANEAPVPHIPTPATPDHEDIFSPPEAADDDLFGRTATPRLEIPRDPVDAPAPAVNGAADMTSTLAYQPGEQHAPTQAQEDATQTLPGHEHAPSWMESAPPEDSPPEPVAAAEESPTMKAVRRSASKGGWFIPLVFMPLLLYSVLLSIYAYRWYQSLKASQKQQQQNLFEMMPEDTHDDGPDAKRIKPIGRVNMAEHIGLKFAKMPLPDHLKVRLNKEQPTPLRIGDLEVTPLKVEQRKVSVFVDKSSRSEPCLRDSLVLHLKLKNISKDVLFVPLDNYFDRQYRGTGQPPLTALQMGDTFFFGGPAHWTPQVKQRQRSQRGGEVKGAEQLQWLDGPGRTRTKDSRPLKPGAEMIAIICTDGGGWPAGWDPKVVEAVEKYGNGPLLWRVHVRRGLIPFRGQDVSATAVIGVEFTAADIEKVQDS